MYGVEEKFIRVCKSLYQDVEASIVLDGKQSRWFKVENGLRQGCPLSPLLYSIYVMGMVEKLEEEGLGVKEGDYWCGALLYADDVVLLAESPDELQKMLDMMGQYAEEWKFSFNASKSKTMVVGATSGSERWRIRGEEMEEVKAFKYLGVWFDRGMRGNVQLEKMKEKAEEWAGKTEWMSRKDGQIEVERGRLVWELLARPSLEHAAEIWWPGGKIANRNLEAVQEKVGKQLLGASRSVPGAAVRGDLGWRKLEERREGKKLMYGKRLEGLEDNRLVKIVAEKLKDAGNVGWWGEYGALQRKYVITEEDQARREWKAKVEEGNDRDWWEEVESKSSLGWYRMAKNEFRLENYIGSSQGQEAVRCWFRMRSGTAGLFADKKRCGLCEEDRCVLCDREEVEDVLHFLVLCDEFEWERQKELKRIGDIEGSDMWLEEFTEEDHIGKMAMLLGRRVVGMDKMAAVKIENVIMAEVLRWWKQRKELIF